MENEIGEENGIKGLTNWSLVYWRKGGICRVEIDCGHYANSHELAVKFARRAAKGLKLVQCNQPPSKGEYSYHWRCT